MKRVLICVLFVLITLLVGTAVGQNSTEQEIAKLEQQFNGAYAKNDLEQYFSFYAPDAIQWLPEGRTDLATYKKDWTAYISAGNRVEAADVLELQVKVSPGGDAASAAYLLHVRTKLASGSVTDEEFQETDVWFKLTSGWKIVALHYSPAAKK